MKNNPGAKKEIAVFVIAEKDYSRRLKEMVCAASSAYSRICFVSLNKPYNTISSSFEGCKAEMKKFFFIDCTGKSKESEGQVVFVSSPKALTEMSITIGKVLDLGKIDAVIFDSLSTLLFYEEPSTVIKFTHSLISLLRYRKAAGMLLCLEGGKNTDLVKDISMFADKVVGGK